VATTPVLGSAVGAIVGGAATVVTVMPNGSGPHDFSPSAAQVDAMMGADLLVVNGENLEEGLADAIAAAADAGVPVFTATDHVDVRDPDSPAEEAEGDHSDDHAGGDPHFWLDPLSMRSVTTALASQIESGLGLEIGTGTESFESELDALHTANGTAVAQVPMARRKLVTGHDSLGYWADRYGFEVIGAVIPSTSTQAEASGRQIADLSKLIRDNGVDVIFTEAGTSEQVAETIASETGARVVSLDVEALPDGGDYIALVSNVTETITSNLT
jgi:zinc/manganese transport system substrate-binding protein